MTVANVDKSTLQTTGAKIKGKAEEIAAVLTGDPVLREQAERDQINSGAPDVSAALAGKTGKLLGRDRG